MLAGTKKAQILAEIYNSPGTGFAAGDHALCLLKSGGVDQYDVLLFRSWVEEVAKGSLIYAFCI
jgi:hypothetical protein